MHKPGIRRGCCSRLLLHVARRFQLFRYPPPDAMSLGHGDIQRAVAILRWAMDNGLDLSGEFAGWTVLQRRSLVQALGGVMPATPPAFGAAAADHGAADPAPEPPADLDAPPSVQVASGAAAGPTSIPSYPAKPGDGTVDQSGATPAKAKGPRIGADWFVINRTTGEGYPPCPRKLPRDATARARAENEAEFRRIVGIYRLLNSLEHTAHIERMHRPGATADFPLPPAMVPSAVRTIDELEERERAADAAPGGHGGLITCGPRRGRLHCHLPGAELPRRARAGAHSRRGVGRRLVRRTLPGPRRHAMHRPRREMPPAGYRPARRRRQPGGAYRSLV